MADALLAYIPPSEHLLLIERLKGGVIGRLETDALRAEAAAATKAAASRAQP
jgi:hypothetical protein